MERFLKSDRSNDYPQRSFQAHIYDNPSRKAPEVLVSHQEIQTDIGLNNNAGHRNDLPLYTYHTTDFVLRLSIITMFSLDQG